ncbi:DUF885 domain-containing protein [Sphingomonas immobilis]|uniref:DUF885 domain-containing protein n=1 Tax=Sphingomonas immobilis TaxID=3063997 RepID=A0ABT8ZTZ9_9SPHN|nr:DUF885 domain-containing protein [Sphingomonas sp. CA1-15]MDO7841046.1 DUF885 domain-containing protein [Sphingomonas sp. CA1-15]
MRRLAILLLATALVPGPVSAKFVLAKVAKPSTAHEKFAALSQRYLDGISTYAPTFATALGDHRGDDRLPDVSAKGRAAQVAEVKAMLAALGRIDRAKLSREDQVDAALLDNELRYEIWQNDVLRNWSWDIQIYNDAAGGALYSLAARDFAPWPQRLAAATTRMEAMPAFLAQARAAIVPAKVPEIYATTVAKQNGGVVEIAEGMLAPHASELDGPAKARFDAALAGLKAAVAEHQTWLDKTLVPQAKGELRLGAKLYDEKVKFALVGSLTRAEIKARATAEVTKVRAQMYQLARKLLDQRPGASPLPILPPSPEMQQATIETALGLSYTQRPPRSGLMDKAKETLASATEFVRAKGLVTMPDAPVRIITMPKFQQGVAVAYDDPPGPLEKGLQNFYAISPIPDDWTDAQATSFLSEYNNYMIHDLSIHEAMPGHYLQLFHANANKSVLRAVLMSGPFVEGWAVYAEGMMADADYLNGDPLFKLTVLKMRLRSITNSLLDIGIHTEGMTREQAMKLMMHTAFQQEREAAGKWTRASLGSTQLLSYFTGYSEHMALREEAKKRQGATFDLKTYNDAVLAHGSPPARFVRQLMFGLPIR